FGSIHRDLGSEFLVVAVADLRLARNEEAEPGAIFAGVPGSLMACDLPILVDVNVFTEIVGVPAAGIDGEVGSGNLDDLTVFRLAFFNDARFYAVDDFRVVKDCDREGVLSVGEPQLISGFENEVCAFASIRQGGLVRTERVAPRRFVLGGSSYRSEKQN